MVERCRVHTGFQFGKRVGKHVEQLFGSVAHAGAAHRRSIASNIFELKITTKTQICQLLTMGSPPILLHSARRRSRPVQVRGIIGPVVLMLSYGGTFELVQREAPGRASQKKRRHGVGACACCHVVPCWCCHTHSKLHSEGIVVSLARSLSLSLSLSLLLLLRAATIQVWLNVHSWRRAANMHERDNWEGSTRVLGWGGGSPNNISLLCTRTPY
jgi:hypothetical protein